MRKLLSLIMAILLIAGCAPVSTPAVPTPTPEVTAAPTPPAPAPAPTASAKSALEPVVFDEQTVESGDYEITAVLTSGYSAVVDGYCHNPTLLCYVNGELLDSALAFEDVLFRVRPYIIRLMPGAVLLGYESENPDDPKYFEQFRLEWVYDNVNGVLNRVWLEKNLSKGAYTELLYEADFFGDYSKATARAFYQMLKPFEGEGTKDLLVRVNGPLAYADGPDGNRAWGFQYEALIMEPDYEEPSESKCVRAELNAGLTDVSVTDCAMPDVFAQMEEDVFCDYVVRFSSGTGNFDSSGDEEKLYVVTLSKYNYRDMLRLPECEYRSDINYSSVTTHEPFGLTVGLIIKDDAPLCFFPLHSGFITTDLPQRVSNINQVDVYRSEPFTWDTIYKIEDYDKDGQDEVLLLGLGERHFFTYIDYDNELHNNSGPPANMEQWYIERINPVYLTSYFTEQPYYDDTIINFNEFRYQNLRIYWD